MDFDLLLLGGTVVDGTGALPEPKDVGVAGERIAAIGGLRHRTARRVIDASGMVIAPGFIDVHVHSELARLGGPAQLSAVRQGVTTELMSPDGFSWAPLQAPRDRELREYLQVFYGSPDLSFAWPTVASYLDEFETALPNNLIPQAPHLAIKVAAMGWDTRPARQDELAAMIRMLEEWLDAGAVGMAAGLEYQPSAASSPDELIELSRVVARRDGVFAPHQRGYNARVREGCADTFQIARASGVAVHISHLGVNEDAQRALDGAAREGIDVTFDMYPYAAACTHLLMMLPEWAQAGGHAAAMARLHDPSRRLLEETARRLEERGEVILAAVEGGPELEGRVLSDLATTAGMAPAAYLAELLASHGGRALAVYRWPERVDGEAVLRATLTHPLFIGGSDGILRGSHPHPRGFGTFPRIVGDHVRAGTLPLEEAVHKVTGRPARRFGIRERGEMREGWYADLTVFDPGLLADLATYADGGKAPAGVTHVAVNGDLVLQDGRPTGTLPGRLLRK